MDKLRQIFSAHPNPASDAGDVAWRLVTAASECANVCTACADACLEDEDPTEKRLCIRLNLDCSDVCTTTARMISRPGEQNRSVLRAQLEACIAACRACAEECERHDSEHCRVCAESCRACIEACEAMIASLVD